VITLIKFVFHTYPIGYSTHLVPFNSISLWTGGSPDGRSSIAFSLIRLKLEIKKLHKIRTQSFQPWSSNCAKIDNFWQLILPMCNVRSSLILNFGVIMSRRAFNLDNFTRKPGIQALCLRQCDWATLPTMSDVQLHGLSRILANEAPNALSLSSNCR
jgi:hypothetical protein